jgi:radical SAM enzyme (TIGR01210 family)
MNKIIANKRIVTNHLHQVVKSKKLNSNNIYDFNKVANSSINKGYLNGKPIKRVIFYLRSRGCEWSSKDAGGCFMCGHYFGTAQWESLPKDSFYNQFMNEYIKYDFSDIPMICLYNAGSILNNNEVPRDELYKILNVIKHNENIKCVILESRPEFIDNDILSNVSNVLSDKRVEIGIGLETSNDVIRNYCINKGFTFSAYLEAVNKIKKYNNIKVLTYLTVKPLFLTVQESIDDVLSSLNKIQQLTDVVSLEPTSIQKNTLVDYLYNNNFYQIPKGWIIQQIISKIEDQSILIPYELRIGGFEFFPIPDLVISNCNKCNKSLYESIDLYNTRQNTRAILDLTCECYNVFKRNIDIENASIGGLSIEERIATVLGKLFDKLIV